MGRSGAADRGALRLANRLVGNPEDAAGLEMPLGGVELEFGRTATCALAGADCPAWAADRPVAGNTPFTVPAGARLRLGTPGRGLRVYLAVRGGLDVPAVLGSRSTDTLAGLGPARLTAGRLLPVGTAATGWPAAEHAPRREPSDPVLLHVIPGPRDDWFTAAALRTLYGEPYTVTGDSDRVGMRLDGPRWNGPGAVNCPPRAWWPARCRCRRPGGPSCSSPTTPSPAGTRSSRWSAAPTSTRPGRPAPATRCASARPEPSGPEAELRVLRLVLCALGPMPWASRGVGRAGQPRVTTFAQCGGASGV